MYLCPNFIRIVKGTQSFGPMKYWRVYTISAFVIMIQENWVPLRKLVRLMGAVGSLLMMYVFII